MREGGGRGDEGGREITLTPTAVKPDLGKHPECFHGMVVHKPVRVREKGLERDSEAPKNLYLEGGKVEGSLTTGTWVVLSNCVCM